MTLRLTVPRPALGLAIALLALLPAGGPARADEPPATPAALVDRFDQALLDCMRDAKTLGFKGRYDRLEPVVGQVFNVPLMTRIAVGAGWSGLTADQQQALTRAFGQFITATYAARFDGYAGEQFVADGTRPLAGGVLVETRLVKPDGQPVALDYAARQIDGHWQVVDVFLTGTISELATRRSEFSAVFERSGYDGLLQTLQAKVAQIQNGA